MKIGTTLMSGILALGLIGTGAMGVADARPGERMEKAGIGYPDGQRHAGKRHGHLLHSMARELDLSETQKDRIREIRGAHASQAKEKAEALREVRRELRGYALSDEFDRGRAEELAARQATLMADLHVLRMAGLNEAWQVLDAAQKEKFAELKEKRESRHGKRSGGVDGHGRQPGGEPHAGRLHH